MVTVSQISTNLGYKGPGHNLHCNLASSDIFRGWLDNSVDIATNLMWDRDTNWIRPDTIVICVYAGEYVDLTFIAELDNRGQPIVVVTPLTKPEMDYKNIHWHQLDFFHYDSLYFRSSAFTWNKSQKFSCLNRTTRAWKYVGLGFFISVLGDKLTYTCNNINFDQSESDVKEIIHRISEYSNIDFTVPDIKTDNTDYKQHTQTDQWQYVEPIQQSYFNITSESFYQMQGGIPCIMPATYLTEKTLKPLAVGSFPVHFGQAGCYRTLTDWGFVGFDSVIDTGYDSIQDDYERLAQLLKNLDSIEVSTTLKDVCYENYRWFNNSFYEYVQSLNQPKIKKLKELVSNL